MMIQPTQLYGFVVVAGLLMAINPCNPWLINDLRAYKAPFSLLPYPFSLLRSRMLHSFAFSLTSYGIHSTKDNVRKNILFMQNKANFRKVKLNVNKVLTMVYVQMDTWSIGKTKPIQSQSKPIKANSKPIKANKMPKQTQYKPKQTQFQSQYMLDNVKRPDPEYDKPFDKHASELFQKWPNCADTNKAL